MNQRKRRRLALECKRKQQQDWTRLWASFEDATDYAGIDYRGRWPAFGKPRVNQDTNGFHFGVIPMNCLAHWAWDNLEPDYGKPSCPKCGNEAVDIDDPSVPDLDELDGTEEEWDREGCDDYACVSCCCAFDASDAYGDEPLGHDLNDGEYIGRVGSDCIDIFIMQSPYYTLAQYCSPCASGAGYCTNPSPNGIPTLCLGHDWFEEGVAPYPIWSVKTHHLIRPKKA